MKGELSVARGFAITMGDVGAHVDAVAAHLDEIGDARVGGVDQGPAEVRPGGEVGVNLIPEEGVVGEHGR